MDDARLIDFLQRAGAGEHRHAGGRSLLDHLIGTAEIVARWGQPTPLRRAGLLHSVYGTDAYGEALLAGSQRGELAAIAGAEAERLAFLFGTVQRRPLLARTHRGVQHLPRS